MILLIQFFLAHIIGDFFLQPGSWIKDKENKKLTSKFLYLHVIIHFALIIIITANVQSGTVQKILWKQAALIAVIHFLIDASKLKFQKEGTKRTWFIVDQLLHLLTIVIVWSCTEHLAFDWEILSNKKILIYLTAILVLFEPSSIFIRTIISQWAPSSTTKIPASFDGAENSLLLDPEKTKPIDKESLVNAGKWIGVIERFLVLVFVLLGKWEGVGFLLAAKSVFRFGDLKDAKDMKLTEYVLIGTLLSFGIAIVTGLMATYLIKT